MKLLKTLPLFLLLVVCTVTFAQTPQAYIQKAMEANGPWQNVQSFHYKSKAESLNPWQAYAYTSPKFNQTEIRYDMDFTNNRYRNEFVVFYPGGYVFNFVTVGKDSTRFLYDRNKARNGKVLLKQGREAFIANRTAPFQSLPYYILQAMLSSGDSLQLIDSSGYNIIRRTAKNGNTQDFYFDKASHRLQKSWRTNGKDIIERFFENYKSMGNLQLPFQNRQTTNGKLSSIEKVKRFDINNNMAGSLFDIPSVYNLQPPAQPKPLAAKEIAKDIYLIEGVGGDRNIVFINRKEDVVVTEAPLSPDVTKGVLDVIRKTLPGKRIGYVHLSHHHNDHTTGIRQWVAEGATIICSPELERPVKDILNGKLGNFTDDYAKSPKEPKFEFINEVKVLDDGSHRIELHAVKSSHAKGMSFLFLPVEAIIYEGDLVTVPEDGTITAAIKATREFYQYLQKRSIHYQRIIGHHGHSFITPVMLEQMIETKQ
jgi:glyoxylase-like metal-dependent hydrolase (beta-lactamase superfamily II)